MAFLLPELADAERPGRKPDIRPQVKPCYMLPKRRLPYTLDRHHTLIQRETTPIRRQVLVSDGHDGPIGSELLSTARRIEPHPRP